MTDPGAPSPGGLLAELRRRGVVRAVVGYAVAAFAALQVSEPILHALHLPDGWLTGLVVLLALGFPVVAVVSWAYDLTSRGLVRTQEVEAEVPGPAAAPRAWRGTLAAVVLTSAALGAGLAWWVLKPPAIPVDADGRIVVAVADFANETGEKELDALSGLLITSLEQSRRLRVLTRGRMADLARQAGRAPEARIDEVLGHELSRRAGARALLVSAIHRFGTRYAVELRAVDPASDRYLFTIAEQAVSREAIPDLIDRLGDRARRELREPGGDAPRVAVGAALTSNLEAYAAFFAAMQSYLYGDEQETHPLLERALALDPGFATARLWLAISESFRVGAPEHDPRQRMAELVPYLERLPERERLVHRAWAAHLDKAALEAERAFDEAIARYPGDKELRLLAGEALYHAEARGEGPLDGARVRAKAEQRFREALQLDPGFVGAALHLVDLGGEPAGVLADLRAVAAARPTAPVLAVLAEAEADAGDPPGALRTAERASALEATPTYGVVKARARILTGLGRLAEATSLLERDLPRIREVPRRRNLLDLLVAIDAALGRRRAALRRIEAAPSLVPEVLLRQRLAGWHVQLDASTGRARDALLTALARVSPGQRPWQLAAALAAEGEVVRAQELARGLAPDDRWEHAYRAAIAWHAGSRDEALAASERVAREMPLAHGAAWRHAQWLLEAGRPAEALTRFEALLRPSYGEWAEAKLLLRARARLGRARALEGLGRGQEAAGEAATLLAEWSRADPDLPLLAEAKDLCQQLGCRAPSRPPAPKESP